VNPVTANVTINGASANVQAGQFNDSLKGNTTYDVRATQFGYSVYDQTIGLPTGVNKTLNILLTNRGWIAGVVEPVNAVVEVDLNPQTVVAGAFNISELGSNVGLHQDYFGYTVTALEQGYVTQTKNVNVTPGNTTAISFILPVDNCTNTPSMAGCGTTVKNCSNTPSLCPVQNNNNNGNNNLLYVGIAVIVVLVAVIAVALLMRRRPAAPAPASAWKEPTGGPGSPPPSP
jgi:hypothetical protein